MRWLTNRGDTLASRLATPLLIVGAVVTLLGSVYLITESRRTIEKQALLSAQSIAYQIGQDRQAYIQHTGEDDFDRDLLHSIGMSVDGKGLFHARLVGIWPVDTTHGPGNAFQVEALRSMLGDPAAVASGVHDVGGQPVLSYMRVERATLQACVDCHQASVSGSSARFGEPRFARGAPIGALLVEIPLGPAIASARANTVFAVLALVIVVGAAGFVISRVISRTVELPVAGLLEAVAPLADGDFSRPVQVRAVAEVARIASAVETVRERVAGVLRDMSGTVGAVQNAAGELAQQAAALASGSQEQASSLEQTTASLKHMTETVRSNAEQAQAAKRIAAHTRDEAKAGGEAVQSAVQAMSGIAEASHRISAISTTIDEIAFQTNLLALNAAVEAARAGDQGRSFAVVASEVRSLALRSAAAAKEIRAVITDTVSRVDEGNVLVNRAGATLTGIVHEVKEVADLVAGIATASVEQADGIEQVNRAAERMDKVTQAAAAQTEHLDDTARSLAGQADQLRREAGRFTLAAEPADVHGAPPQHRRAA